MQTVSRRVVHHAHDLAREIDARAVVVLADAIEGDEELRQLVRTVNFRTILITRANQPLATACPHGQWVVVPNVPMTRTGQVKVALLVCLARGLLGHGDRVVCLTGLDGSNVMDTVMVLDLGSEPELFALSDAVPLGEDVSPEVFERTLTLATELAVEGREGRPVGALFVVGDSERVLRQSRPLILNPFHGYPEGARNILDSSLAETIKEFSAIDGAFVVRGDGVVLAAGIQLVPTSHPPAASLANGLGTRHAAAAAISASTDSVAIVISHSTGTVSVFKSGCMLTDIHKPVNGNHFAL